MAPQVFVTVGTDHHPFDRLVDWIDSWLEAAGSPVECFLQTGTSRAPRHGSWRAYVPHAELEGLCRRSVAVVCHGGPATIMDCRRAGAKPIVVPRRQRFGEHVDDHQLRFSRRAASDGYIILTETEEQLRSALDRAIADPATMRIDPSSDSALSETIRRFAALADPLVGRREG